MASPAPVGNKRARDRSKSISDPEVGLFRQCILVHRSYVVRAQGSEAPQVPILPGSSASLRVKERGVVSLVADVLREKRFDVPLKRIR